MKKKNRYALPLLMVLALASAIGVRTSLAQASEPHGHAGLCPGANPSLTCATNNVPALPQQGESRTILPLIPYPVRVEFAVGEFRVESLDSITISDPNDPELRALAEYCAGFLEATIGRRVPIAERAARVVGQRSIALQLTPGGGPAENAEAYQLEVTPRGVALSASEHRGLFYALQTLRQLLPSTAERGPIRLPAVRIEDEPRFVYRGMHLDVGRHFFPVEFIKKYIDLLAAYKLNTFHWHLTEDQGWRIEIKKYPLLTRVGAYRKETILAKNFDPYIGDRKPYGGYYTQDEIREVVAYARTRYVTIVPEIEMPGHSTAALAAYPELACTAGPFEVATIWGIHEDIYCPSERTFAFLTDVLSEVIELFPGLYVHIGGDEAPKRRWEESLEAQRVIEREGLTDEHELQSYFIRRIESFLLEHDRRLIGWDEILEGGLAPQATVMSWRGTAGGIEAARQGHDVIMTPTSHVYFDYYQGDPLYEPLAIGGYTPLEKVYDFEPVPEELTGAEAAHILGAQGNVWTEYMKTTQYVEYMVFPRMLALAEGVWSPRQTRSWESFVSRLPAHLGRLDDLRVHYRVPHVRGLEADRITLGDSLTLHLQSLIPDARIHYTTDGSDPTPASPVYAGLLELPVDERGVWVKARAYLPGGRVSPVRAARFARATLRPALDLETSKLGSGLRYAYYEARVSSVNDLEELEPSRQGTTPDLGFPGFERQDEFGLEFSGYIRIPSSGIYTFQLQSDDGSALEVAGRTVINHDGYHVSSGRSGQVALAAGLHPISLRYFQAWGDRDLRLEIIDGEGNPVADSSEWWFHAR